MSKPFHEIYSSSQGMILNGEPVDHEGKKRKPIRERPRRQKGRWKKNSGWIAILIIALLFFVPLPLPFHRTLQIIYMKTEDQELLQTSELEMKGWVFHYAFKPNRFIMQLREQVLTEEETMDSGWVWMEGSLLYEQLGTEVPDGMINFRFDEIPDELSPMFAEFFGEYFSPVTKGHFQWILARSQSAYAVGPAKDVDEATEQILAYIDATKYKPH